MNHIFQWIHRIGEWIVQGLYLQLLWFVFTLAGLVVFGFMPATTAVYTVCRKNMLDDHDDSITQTFLTAYKENIIGSNILGMIMVSLALFLYFDLKIVRLEIPFYPLYIALLFLAVLYFLIMLYIFPVFAHYQLKKAQYVKQALFIALARPLETIGMIVLIISLYYIFYFLPILFIFLSVPLVVDPMMRIAFHAFNGLNKKAKKPLQTKLNEEASSVLSPRRY